MWLRLKYRGFIASAFVCNLLTLLLPAGQAFAQNQPPFAIVRPKDTVQLEHRDRMSRLERLSGIEGIQPPEFREYQIPPDEHGLKDFPVPIPVLRVIFRDTVFFDFDKADLKPEAYAVLNVIARSLRLEPPDVTVFVAGHTDAIGSVDYNLGLGLRRAKAVAVELAKIGVSQSQIFLISFGKAVPIDTNDTEEGRAHNRRVEFLFAARPEPIAAWLAQQPYMMCTTQDNARGDNCPVDLTFPALSVDLKHMPTGVGASTSPTSINPSEKPTDIDPGTSTQDIVIGSKVVDIDLRHKIFHMRAPE